MRLLFTIILCTLIIGGTWAYIDFDNGIRFAASEVNYGKAEGKTTIEVDRTFECFGNAEFEEPAIKVSFGGKVVFLNDADSVAADEPIAFELLDVENELNTLTVFANPISPDSFGDDGPALRAMLARVKYDGVVIAEKLFHADGSASSLGGDITFEIPASKSHDEHDHE